ncbi:hypothetical protein [Agrococcus casei]|uniref:hypothetical protein n=1 Tax=Agrococcus casei TaxID=343512 RepID=UPI003F9235C5
MYVMTFPRARVPHRCEQCFRTIDPGEVYARVAASSYSDFFTGVACAHCHITQLAIGDRDDWFREASFWGGLPEYGRFAEAALDDADVVALLRLEVGYRRQWRRRDGSLMPLPALSRGQWVVELDGAIGNVRGRWLPSLDGWTVRDVETDVTDGFRCHFQAQSEREAARRNRAAGGYRWYASAVNAW